MSDQITIDEFQLNSDYFIRFNQDVTYPTSSRISERYTILDKLDEVTLLVKFYLDAKNYEINVNNIYSYRGPLENINYNSRTAYNLELCEPQFKDSTKPNWHAFLSKKYGSENILHRGKTYWYNYLSLERLLDYSDMRYGLSKDVVASVTNQMILEQRVEAIPLRQGVGTEFDETYGFNLINESNNEVEYRQSYNYEYGYGYAQQWASRTDILMKYYNDVYNPALLGKYNLAYYKHYNPEEEEQNNARIQSFYLKEVKRILEENGVFDLEEIKINKFGKLFGIPNQAVINEQIKEFGLVKGTYSLLF